MNGTEKECFLALLDYFAESKFISPQQNKQNVRRLAVIKKMSNRFLLRGEINDKLIINNIIITYNIYGTQNTNKLLWLFLTRAQFAIIKPILIFLGIYNPADSDCDNIQSNRIILDMLADYRHRYHLESR